VVRWKNLLLNRPTSVHVTRTAIHTQDESMLTGMPAIFPIRHDLPNTLPSFATSVPDGVAMAGGSVDRRALRPARRADVPRSGC
jgi:hypothetical protein